MMKMQLRLLNNVQASGALRSIKTITHCLLVLMTLALSACDKHSDSDGHDHGSPKGAAPKAHTDGDGHDHGQDQGHGESETKHTDEATLTAEAIERYGVKVETAQKWLLAPTIVTPARVGFNTEAMAHVGSPLRGRIVSIKVRLGQEVKKGEELCVIESPELGEAQGDLLQKRVTKESAGPASELAKVSWERAKGLYERTQGTSLTDVQRREAEYKAALAAQRAADAAVMTAENRLHLLGMSQSAVDEFLKTGEVAPRYTVHAPIDGRVVQREITQGELVGPEREALLVLADMTNVWVLADVPESRLGEVAVGSKAWVRVGSSDAPPVEGQVAFIAPQVDATTRTAQVRIEAATEDRPLKPGMFAQVELVMSGGAAGEPMVAVPDAAVQTVEGGPAVFVPVDGEANTFAKRAVIVGKSTGGLIPIHQGLVEGERFVAAGSFILKAELGKGSAAHEH